MMLAMRRLLAILLALLLVSAPALAREAILSFVSDVTIDVDGTLTVRETITVKSEGDQIRRGILRDFPTSYHRADGTRVRVGFDVLAVTRDGADEPFVIETMSNGKRLRIGEKDVFLEDGEHTYEITYRTDRQLGFFDTHDELYWNVTGNGWTFPIEKAFATIRLPAGAIVQQYAVYTGKFGESGTDASVEQASGNRFSASTLRTLQPGEGFTVAVGWQKGIVAPPSAAQLQRDWINDNLGLFALVATLVLVSAYYALAWFKVGRDPAKGNIFPLFHPPDGLGPAGVRYVWRKGFDDKAFAAALVGLAVKGKATISEEGGTFSIAKRAGGQDPLTRSETALLRKLPQVLKLEQGHHSSVAAARSALSGSLDDEYDGHMFVNNFIWFALGCGLSMIGLLLAGFLLPESEGAMVLFTTAFTSIWWGMILAVGYSMVKGLFGSGGLLLRIRALMGLIFLVPFVGAGIAVPTFSMLADGMSPAIKWFIAGSAVLAGCNLLFYWLLKAPTPSGRQVLDQIEGFRMYMRTAEEERLKVLHPPEKTPELFERYLPYAMALDCENEWNEKFAKVLAAAAAAGTAAGIGGWYHGSEPFGSRSFSDSLGSSLTSSIASAATPPGRSSGSGGGGFSGGGGGGGGGSGW